MTSIVLGLLNGLTIGLLAIGLVLVFKANRFVNLAHGQLGVISAALLAKLGVEHHWNWWLAFPVCVGVGIILGVAVEQLIIRRVRERTSSSRSLLLVTVGVAQVLLAVTYLKILETNQFELLSRGYPLPFNAHVSFGGVRLDTSDLIILLFVPAVTVALGLFLRSSITGKTIRAAASNPDAASLCGVSVRRVSVITWGIAGGLSALTAVLVAPSQTDFNVQALGPLLLLEALGAAAMGGFTSVPLAVAGGLLIGLADQLTLHVSHNSGTAHLVAFLVIMIVLLGRGRLVADPASRIRSDDQIESLAPTRIPASVRDRAIVRYRRAGLYAFATAVAVLLPLLPYFRSEAHRFELVLVLIYALAGVALTMMIGWSGQLSLGHFALVGVGACVAAKYSLHGWSLPLLLLAAAVTGALAMVILAIPVMRLSGLALAVTTLGFAVIGPDWLFQQSWFGTPEQGGVPLNAFGLLRGMGHPGSQLDVYFISLVVLIIVLVAVSGLRRSVPGRLVMAVRDNEDVAASVGVSPSTVKLALFAVSGAVAAMAGVLWADSWQTVSASQFPPQLSLSILAVPVIGGLGSISGAVAGGALLYLSTFFLSPLLTSALGSTGRQIGFQLALGGMAMVAIPLAYPKGLAGFAQNLWEKFLEHIDRVIAHEPDVDRASPLEVTNLAVHFGGVQALQSISISVERGEIVGLIGANGAGKTTLLNAVSGVITPDHGSVKILGREVGDLPPELRAYFGLGRTFQNARLFPGLTVLETIQVGLSHRGRVGFVAALARSPWARGVDRRTVAEANAIVERFGLGPWASSLVSDLSTGTRRILDLAMQMAARRSVLLLDEPTAGVAQREAEAFGPLLQDLRAEIGCSILLVEHDMPLLMSVCDRIYALEAGQVIAEGTPRQIRSDPRVIASYLGTDDVAIARSGARVGARASTHSGAAVATVKRRPATRRASTNRTAPSANGKAGSSNGKKDGTPRRKDPSTE